MKKYLKYVISGLVFFLTMLLFDYIFKFDINLIVNIGATVIYLVLNILCDYFFNRQNFS